MLGMTTHSENITRVQQELWYLINDEDTRKVLEAMIEKMKEVGDSSERIKQWRQEAQAHSPADPKYDENYWVAAYILYTNMEKFKALFDRLTDIDSELSELESKIEESEREQEYLENRIEDLRYELESLREEYEEDEEDAYDEDEEEDDDWDEEEDEAIADLRYQIEELEEELQSVKDNYEETLDRYYELEEDKKYLLWEIMELAEQLVAS
jgi:chromosome segregation ATPase